MKTRLESIEAEFRSILRGESEWEWKQTKTAMPHYLRGYYVEALYSRLGPVNENDNISITDLPTLFDALRECR